MITDTPNRQPRADAEPSTVAALDRMVDELQAHKDDWARLAVPEKIALLEATRENLRRLAGRWVDASVNGKGIDAASPWVGEEWVTAPWALAAGINGFLETLEAVAGNRSPRLPGVRTRDDGRLVVRVFPHDLFDRLLLSGIKAEVWMRPGITEATLADHVAGFYRQQAPTGAVTLVLAAGNVNSIAPADTLYRLVARGQVVLLKQNPVNEYQGPILEEIFQPFVDAGYLRLAYGGAEVGAYLAGHDGIDEIHLTGSAQTHDAIVFGVGEEGWERRRRGEPRTTKPVTSELGGVGPTIVLPGDWSAADLRYQAENVVTMKLHNGGFNCVSSQLLVLPEAWDQRHAFMAEVRRLLAELPSRADWYPGIEERRQAALAAHPEAESLGGDPARILIADLPPAAADHCFRSEFFGPIWAQVTLPGDDPADYLRRAVELANESLAGTLGATLVVHPRAARELGPELDRAIADLRYGSIGVNVWNAVAYLLAQAPWGAFPGHTPDDIQSGTGVVHNSYLLADTEKTVVYGSFYPFPRSWLHGDLAILPKPPWFVTNRTAHVTARRVAAFAMDPGWRHVPGIFWSALRG